MLDQKVYGRNVAIKIYVKKVFDTLNWKFLLNVLRTYGFHNHSAIRSSSSLQNLSLRVNGNLVAYFFCKYGVRNGDSFSFTFFLYSESLESRNFF